MGTEKRLSILGFVAVFALAVGVAPARAADTPPDVVAFYLQGTCLCSTVPTAQEALGLADGYLEGAGPITGVGYPAGLLFALDSAIGASGVKTHLDAVPDGIKITLAGVSQGAIVLDYVKQSLALQITPARPRADLAFVTFGDPMNSTGGIVAKNPLLWLSVPPGILPTPYATTEIVREYDGLSDWPDRPTTLSVLNAVMGVAYVHPFYGAAADPDTPGTLKTVSVNAAGGTTTHYVVPTEGLPITQPLRDVGLDTTLVDRWLRPQIDHSYKRRPTVVAADSDTTQAEPAPRPAEATPKTAKEAAPQPATDDSDADRPVRPKPSLPITQPLRKLGINTTAIDRWLRPQTDRSDKRRPTVATAEADTSQAASTTTKQDAQKQQKTDAGIPVRSTPSLPHGPKKESAGSTSRSSAEPTSKDE
ncbi:PE-PPE domain-containing protein [Mycolicibacterium sp. 120266]|uniref:PE-PPE domain-containing protein n=1 Tax=Mycolicibacterium sp. 120266 TaxID=3090601 RepID=UPI00299CF568|nr:PE-PPE domain-containing protein [Mycolicibacterium sp. 120266]MDX1873628.1 PE-PPE domain-containing protein [Mycolicibacterium sp. 120266]